jgi:hypothetical protein
MNSKVGFWLHPLGGKFLVFSRALLFTASSQGLPDFPCKRAPSALLQVSAGSLVPDAKIGAASLPKFQLLNSFVYTKVLV